MAQVNEADCWNKAMFQLNKGLNKGHSWPEALQKLIEFYEGKKSGATAPDLLIFDFMIGIFKSKLVI